MKARARDPKKRCPPKWQASLNATETATFQLRRCRFYSLVCEAGGFPLGFALAFPLPVHAFGMFPALPAPLVPFPFAPMPPGPLLYIGLPGPEAAPAP
jgi:hypothetical protein